jgi:hypothetical protein
MEPNAIPVPRTVDPGRAVGWWTDAWALFMKNPGMWIVLSLLMLAIYFVLAFIPVLGSLAGALAGPAFIGSWMLAARKVEGGGTLELGDLFAGFRAKLAALVTIGALLLAATIVIGIVIGALGMGAAGGMMSAGAPHGFGGMMVAGGGGLATLLVAMVLGVFVALAIWFAPALVVFRDVAPVDALKASVSASLKNIGAFVVYGLLYIVAAFVASIPLGLGWIVLVPIVVLTAYVSYREVFGP